MDDKTVFDIDDIREIRRKRTTEYSSMNKEEARELQDKRVEEGLRKIAQFHFAIKSIDVCRNDLKAMKALHEQTKYKGIR